MNRLFLCLLALCLLSLMIASHFSEVEGGLDSLSKLFRKLKKKNLAGSNEDSFGITRPNVPIELYRMLILKKLAVGETPIGDLYKEVNTRTVAKVLADFIGLKSGLIITEMSNEIPLEVFAQMVENKVLRPCQQLDAILSGWRQQTIEKEKILKWNMDWLIAENVCQIVVSLANDAMQFETELVREAYNWFNYSIHIYAKFLNNRDDLNMYASAIRMDLKHWIKEDFDLFEGLADIVRDECEITDRDWFDSNLPSDLIVNSLAGYMSIYVLKIESHPAAARKAKFEEMFRLKTIMPCQATVAELAGWYQVSHTRTGLPASQVHWFVMENVCKTIVSSPDEFLLATYNQLRDKYEI